MIVGVMPVIVMIELVNVMAFRQRNCVLNRLPVKSKPGQIMKDTWQINCHLASTNQKHATSTLKKEIENNNMTTNKTTTTTNNNNKTTTANSKQTTI